MLIHAKMQTCTARYLPCVDAFWHVPAAHKVFF